MAVIVWFFKGFQESILSSFVHSIGRRDDEKTVFGLTVIS